MQRVRPLLGNILLATGWILFLYANVKGFEANRSIILLLGIGNQSLVILFFLIRSRAKTVSRSAFDWAVAFCGTFFPTLLRPTLHTLIPQPFLYFVTAGATICMVVGTIITIVGILTLNRSFGIVPAQRQIKISGIYRIIRHPIYAGDILTLLGYILGNGSLENIGIALLAGILITIRIEREEYLLSQNETYRAYTEATRFKLIPHLY